MILIHIKNQLAKTENLKFKMGNTTTATNSSQQQQQQYAEQKQNLNTYSHSSSQQQQQGYVQQQQVQVQQQQQQSYTSSVTSQDGVIDFGDRVVISYNFWKDNVDMLERSKQQQLGVLLFAKLFKKQPLCRKLFADSDISKQSLRLLDMFGWLLRSLVKEKNQMRRHTLKSLGDRHIKYGIKIEFFRPMLDALSDSLQDWFGTNYNTATRVALTTLFQSACNEMMKQAGERAPFARAEVVAKGNDNSGNNNEYGVKSYRWLRSLDHCLADPLGLDSLEQYLSKSYSSELTEFHKAYRIYRCCLTPRVRKEIAHEICKLFLSEKAQFELNDSGDNRKKIYNIMQKCDELQLDYPIDLFDETHVWVKFQISQNAWMKFKVMIQSTE
eukprot:160414_1